MNIDSRARILGLAILLSSVCTLPSEARGFRSVGPRGVIGAGGGSFTGANGGTISGLRGGFAGRNAGLGGGAYTAVGPNGGTRQASALAGYRRGVGAFEGTNKSWTGPNGSSYNGFTRGKYNAQTGMGTYNASHQTFDAQNGKTYGDTNSTSFTKGQGGVTQLDTDNHGDYSIDWAKGQKPVVTQD